MPRSRGQRSLKQGLKHQVSVQASEDNMRKRGSQQKQTPTRERNQQKVCVEYKTEKLRDTGQSGVRNTMNKQSGCDGEKQEIC